MNPFLFLSLFTALGALYFILGIRASKNVTTDADYFVAGRQLGTWQISCNLIATQLGGGMLLGTASNAYVNGYYGILYTIGMALGFLLLACGVASRLQKFKVTTTAQLFETQYHSSTLKMIASALSIATLFGILIAQVVGFKSLMTALGFGAWWIVLPFWLSVVAYTMIGGLRAITINDMVQLALITATFTAVFLVSLISHPFSILQAPQTLFATQPIGATLLASSVLMPTLFSLIEQDLAQRFFASRTGFVATSSALNAGLFLLVFSCIPVYLGMQAKITGIIIPAGANPLIVLLGQTMPELLFALALCALVAAIISTADALMNGISANITQDFKIGKSFSNSLTVSKCTTMLVGLLALVSSYFVSNDIIDIIISSYEISVSCLLVPLLFCYYQEEVRTSSAYGAIVCGLFGFVIFRIYPQPIPKEILALALSGLGYAIGNCLPVTTRK